MHLHRWFKAAAISSGMLGLLLTLAPAPAPANDGATVTDATKTVRISYRNLTASQPLGIGTFVTHNASAPPLFALGKPASFGLMRVAEEGNPGPMLAAVVIPGLDSLFGSAAVTTDALPGQSRSVDIVVSPRFPMLSAVMMLVKTNDGFTGVSALNVYDLTEPKTIELMAYDAGTERNNEKKAYLIAMKGTGRDPENGVVTRHTGIRGDADAPKSWQFDVHAPVAELTVTPLSK